MAPRHTRLFLTALPLLGFLVFWEVLVTHSTRLKFLFGSPSAVFLLGLKEYSQTSFWMDLFITAAEALSGLLIGTLLGIIFGITLWSNKTIELIVRPYLCAIGSIPIFALAPMLIIWFGIGFSAKVVMASFGVFILALIHIFEGLESTAEEHLQFARQLGAGPWAVLTKVLLPSSFRWILLATRINVSIALLGAFIAEFISSQAGLGHYIIEAGQLYDIPALLFGVFNLTLIALGTTKLIDNLAHRFTLSN